MNVLFPRKLSSQRPLPCRNGGFTLVEMLVATAILAIMVGMIAVIGSSTNKVWTQSSQRIGEFQGARNAFELLTRTIAQATLNTYYTVTDNSATGLISSYGRTSDLEFVSGTTNATGLNGWGATDMTGNALPAQITHAIFFAAPFGYTATVASTSPSYVDLDNLLGICGFYIQYSKGIAGPSFLAGNASENAFRFRLMEVFPPTENFSIYSYNSLSSSPNGWIAGLFPMAYPNKSDWVHQVASNIIALVISPEDPSQAYVTPPALPSVIAPNYDYDSWPNSKIAGQGAITSCQLPPVLHIAMVAIDEKSAVQMGNPATPPDPGLIQSSNPPLFSTITTTTPTFESDLATLQNNLAAKHINSRVFETRVALRGSKWSSQ